MSNWCANFRCKRLKVKVKVRIVVKVAQLLVDGRTIRRSISGYDL